MPGVVPVPVELIVPLPRERAEHTAACACVGGEGVDMRHTAACACVRGGGRG